MCTALSPCDLRSSLRRGPVSCVDEKVQRRSFLIARAACALSDALMDLMVSSSRPQINRLATMTLRSFDDVTCVSRPNDVRIDCEAAQHSDARPRHEIGRANA